MMQQNKIGKNYQSMSLLERYKPFLSIVSNTLLKLLVISTKDGLAINVVRQIFVLII